MSRVHFVGAGRMGLPMVERLVGDGPVFPVENPDAAFTLLRIGDAVASRNIHAAIYDGIRFALRI